jgi:hypothetical protein
MIIVVVSAEASAAATMPVELRFNMSFLLEFRAACLIAIDATGVTSALA